MSDVPLKLLILLVLMLINAFFAASEIAIISLSPSNLRQIREMNTATSKALLRLTKEPNRLLSTIQVGITLAGFFASASAAQNFSAPVGRFLAALGLPYAYQIAFGLVTILLSYVTLVFGELVPKRIALASKEKIALAVARPIEWISLLAKPFVRLLSLSTSLVLKVLRIKDEAEEEMVSREEILRLLRVSSEQGSIDHNEELLLSRVIELRDTEARQIMTPSNRVFSVDVDGFDGHVFTQMIDSGFSRFPVYEEDRDHIIGLLYMKDILAFLHQGEGEIDIRQLIRKPFFVLENRFLDDILRDFQREKIHLGIVIDEYGTFSGILAIEEILEEIVGEIDDEFDTVQKEIVKTQTGWRINGLVSLHDIHTKLGWELEDKEITTLSGYLLYHHGTSALVPGSVFTHEGLEMTVEQADQKGIDWVHVRKLPETWDISETEAEND